jgi:hypothetical protein
MIYIHKDCAHEACISTSELEHGDTYVVLDPKENYRIGDRDEILARCEHCGEPSELDAREQAEAEAYWTAWFVHGQPALHKLRNLRDTSDDELDALSRDCGKRIRRS